MLASDDVVFAWAIGKALLIVIVSVATLVYVAWAATYQKKQATHIGNVNDSAFEVDASVIKSAALLTASEPRGDAKRTSTDEIQWSGVGAARCADLAFVEIALKQVDVDKSPLC